MNTALTEETTIKKIIRIALFALIINSALLFIITFEDITSLLNSVTNFSITIAPHNEKKTTEPSDRPPPTQIQQQSGGGGKYSSSTALRPQKPQLIAPGAGTIIALPFDFSVSQFINVNNIPFSRSIWLFRHADETYDNSFFMIALTSADAANGSTITIFRSDRFKPGKTYFWKAAYINTYGLWSDFSDEQNFTVQPLPIVQKPTKQTPTTQIHQPAPKFKPAANQRPTQIQKKPVTTKLPSVNIKLKNTKIKKGKSVQIKILKKPRQKSSFQSKKKLDVQIDIKNAKKDRVLNQKESIPLPKQRSIQNKNVKKSKNLSVGTYVATLSFVDDNTLYAFTETFEVVPTAAIGSVEASRILFWLEITLLFLLSALIGRMYALRRHTIG